MPNNATMRTTLLFLLVFSLVACGGGDNDNNINSDTLSTKDSLKKPLSEDLPPSSDPAQFEWIYSTFVASAVTDAPRFNIFINKDHGLWIINSNGALPQMINVKDISGVKNSKGDSLVPMDQVKMVCTPKVAGWPEIKCDMPSGWSMTGCYTTEQNKLKESKIWEYAGLNDANNKKVTELAAGITRAVVNTEMNMVFYFTEINGTWYLTFLDIRKPCEA
jgi:hypothetical protein